MISQAQSTANQAPAQATYSITNGPPDTFHSRHFTDQERIHAARCERVAIWWLKILGLEDLDYTGSWHWYPEWIDCQARPFPGKYDNANDLCNRSDLYSPSKNLWFEVTHCPVSFSRSADVFGRAKLLVLADKITKAQQARILDRTWFVSVNVMESDIRFIHGPDIIRYGPPQTLSIMPSHEGQYFVTPWYVWLKAAELCEILKLSNSKEVKQ